MSLTSFKHLAHRSPQSQPDLTEVLFEMATESYRRRECDSFSAAAKVDDQKRTAATLRRVLLAAAPLFRCAFTSLRVCAADAKDRQQSGVIKDALVFTFGAEVHALHIERSIPQSYFLQYDAEAVHVTLLGSLRRMAVV